MRKTIRFLGITTGCLLALASTSTGAADKLPVHYQAFAVDMSTAAGGAAAGPLDITIERWTAEEERAKLRAALVEKGSDALLNALQDTKKVGFIRATGGGLGWNLHYARKEPLPDGGYRVVFATDRPMSFRERVNQPRSAEYEFVVAELRIGQDGEGEGKLFPAAKVSFDKGENAIEIENYANEPVQLTKVRELNGDEDEKDKASTKPRD
jgi:hypothetical protein